ncbi:flagellar motor switch protein FliM [Angustibacter luteus]|uniref:Flagellar motor switch protein FliM n=1 Tax=Angustibacter luteus TaxID=658456 RepID=A0ABW1JGV4_9ACTN
MPSNDSVDVTAGRAEPQPYDFRRPTKLAREQGRLLEMVYETVARQWATVLGSELGAACQVAFSGVEQRSYDDYVSELPSPNLLAVFAPDPHGGAAFLQVAPHLGFEAIERMLGGTGGEQPDRIPTEIETQLLLRVIERMLGELRYGLAAVTDVDPVFKSLEFNPQFVQVAAATDLYIVATFIITIGEASAPASVALPAATLVMRSGDGSGADDPGARQAKAVARATMTQLVEDVPVDVSVRFVPRATPTARLLELREGDLVKLGHPVDRPLDLVSAGIVFARGVAGAQGPRAACLITDSAITDSAISSSAAASLANSVLSRRASE